MSFYLMETLSGWKVKTAKPSELKQLRSNGVEIFILKEDAKKEAKLRNKEGYSRWKVIP